MMHAYYKLGWSQRSSCALALATRQSWQRPHLQGMSVAKARQTRRSLLGCKYWNMVLWSGSGRGCFGYPAFARRSIEGRIKGPAQRFSLAVRHRFFWRCQKKWGREKYVSRGDSPLLLGTFCRNKKCLAARRNLTAVQGLFSRCACSRRPAFVLAKFAWLHFRLTAKTALAALLVLSP